MSDQPTTIREQAIIQHEIFTSYIDAGFTREEALELLKVQVIEGIRSS